MEWWNEDGAELVAQTELSGAVMLTAPLCLFLLKTDVQRFVSSIGCSGLVTCVHGWKAK